MNIKTKFLTGKFCYIGIKDWIKNKTDCVLIFMFRYDKFFVLPGSNKVCLKHRVRGGTQQHTFCSLVYRHPGFFSFQHCAKIIALIGAARSVVQFYCTMKRMRNCAKQVKKTVRIKTVYFFFKNNALQFFNPGNKPDFPDKKSYERVRWVFALQTALIFLCSGIFLNKPSTAHLDPQEQDLLHNLERVFQNWVLEVLQDFLT